MVVPMHPFLETIGFKLLAAMQEHTCPGCREDLLADENVCVACCKKFKQREVSTPLKDYGAFSIYSATQFNTRLKKSLYGFKFYQDCSQADILQALIMQYWQELENTLLEKCPSIIASNEIGFVPIPARQDSHKGHRATHPKSLPAQLAKQLAFTFDSQYLPELLQWNAIGTPQHTVFSRQKRLKNVQGKLSVNEPVLTALKQPPKLLVIVDDITTTHATLREAQRAFMQQQVRLKETAFLGLTLTYVPISTANIVQRASRK
jgi:predicted amidophosphoribosyltransferase